MTCSYFLFLETTLERSTTKRHHVAPEYLQRRRMDRKNSREKKFQELRSTSPKDVSFFFGGGGESNNTPNPHRMAQIDGKGQGLGARASNGTSSMY